LGSSVGAPDEVGSDGGRAVHTTPPKCHPVPTRSADVSTALAQALERWSERGNPEELRRQLLTVLVALESSR